MEPRQAKLLREEQCLEGLLLSAQWQEGDGEAKKKTRPTSYEEEKTPPKEKSQGGWIKETWNSMSKRAVTSQGQNWDKSRHISSAKTQDAIEMQRRCLV